MRRKRPWAVLSIYGFLAALKYFPLYINGNNFLPKALRVDLLQTTLFRSRKYRTRFLRVIGNLLCACNIFCELIGFLYITPQQANYLTRRRRFRDLTHVPEQRRI